MKRLLLATFMVMSCHAEPHLPVGTRVLSSAAPKGRGPLALVNLNHQVLGHAFVFGGTQPDLFVAGYGGPKAVHLFRRVSTAENGVPVFAELMAVICPFQDKGTVFQTSDGRITGWWIDREDLVTKVLDCGLWSFVKLAASVCRSR